MAVDPAASTPGSGIFSVSQPRLASGPLTLKFMLVIALLGMPVVVGYTIWMYWLFKGKVDISHEGAHY